VTDSLRMIVARLSTYGDIFEERQTPLEDDTNTFMSSATGKIDTDDGY